MTTEKLKDIFESYKKKNVQLFPNDATLYQDFVIIITRVDCPETWLQGKEHRKGERGFHSWEPFLVYHYSKILLEIDCIAV